MRHGKPRSLLVAMVASIAVAGCGSADDDATSAASTATAAAPAATAPATTPAVATTTTPATTTSTTPSTASTGVITKGSNGKMYRCVGPNLLSELRTLSRRIDRGRSSLKRIRSELRRLKKRYPNSVAPPRVAQRYNYLVRKHNALLRLGNKRVRAYNGRLEKDCARG